MTLRRFIGLMIFLSGIIFLFSGVVMMTYDLNESDFREPVYENVSNVSSIQDSEVIEKIFVTLPAPQSIVSSPILVRGRVTGIYDEVKLMLFSGEILLVETTTLLDSNNSNVGEFLFQTSLEYEIPQSANGRLEVKLIHNGKIVDEEMVSINLISNYD